MMKYKRLRGTGHLERTGEDNFMQGFGGGLKKEPAWKKYQNEENIKIDHKNVVC
jgi:hypothetical protein